jgi:predicted amidohydrolase
MKIGYIQCLPALGDLDETIRRIELLVDEAAVADLVVLPELCNSGYNFESYDQAWQTSEVLETSIFVDFLESKCRECGFYAVSGFNERDGQVLYNSALLVGPGGHVGTYRKLHLFMNEKDFFQPGNVGLPVFNLGMCRVGMAVCFDWIFPEVWRILALKGAEVICHPSNLVLPGLAQRAVPVHALINHVFCITANRVGSERDVTFTGLSVIADPKGKILALGSQTAGETAIVDADVRLARDKRVTARNDIFEDRRPQEYATLVADAADATTSEKGIHTR